MSRNTKKRQKTKTRSVKAAMAQAQSSGSNPKSPSGTRTRPAPHRTARNASAANGSALHALNHHNPDVLTCLANLSNDEVFTPPPMVNRILDLLPDHIWCDPKVRFLDPVCKSGVFLREIAKRLDVGLQKKIPD